MTLERKPPSTMVFVNVVRISALSSGPNELRRITRRQIVPMAAAVRAASRRRSAASCPGRRASARK